MGSWEETLTDCSAPRSLPPSDLLGDDCTEAPRDVPDNSAEIGNKQTQLANTNKSVSDLEKTRGDLEKSTASSAAQLEELESMLSAARVKHEAESKAVVDLRIRVGEQTAKLKQLNGDVISAESDLTAMKMEKDELEQALLRDKEEVRGLQKKMKEMDDEKAALKGILEKLKKDARQQKGMVTIAKKQLSTAEGSRDEVQQEVQQADQAPAEPEQAHVIEDVHPAGVFSPSTITTAAGVPLPTTPRTLSPAPTGTSQRSNNPFDRLGRGSQGQQRAPVSAVQSSPLEGPSSPSIITTGMAAAGAAAGIVAARAATLYIIAKDAISPEEEKPASDGILNTDSASEAHPDETDPFGASIKAPIESKQDPPALTAPQGETDPFGAPTSAGPAQSAFDTDFESGFGDSFTAPKSTVPAAPNLEAPTDFDAVFADFDQTGPEPQSAEIPPVTSADVKSPVEEAKDLMAEGIPSGLPKSATPGDLRPEDQRSMSTVAMPSSSMPHTLQSEVPPEFESSLPASRTLDEPVSSDEEESPEDLEAPKNDYKSKSRNIDDIEPTPAPAMAPALPVLSPPVTSPAPTDTEPKEPKTRRSAPPPPSARFTTTVPPASADEFDPFGAPAFTPAAASTLPPPTNATHAEGNAPAAATPKTSNFEDNDVDFSDLPPATVDQRSGTEPPVGGGAASAFDDEFAGFDDEFDKPSTGQDSDVSNGMSKSYEMVSPVQPSAPTLPGESGKSQVQTIRHYDEWGFGAPIGNEENSTSRGAGAFSFDDAFGGEFEPA